MSASEGIKDILYLRSFMEDILDIVIERPIRLWQDNQSAIAIMDHATSHARTKHIDVRYHFIRDFIKRDVLSVDYCPTGEMIADLFTKALPATTLTYLRDRILGEYRPS